VDITIGLLLALLVVSLQFRAGAYHAEFDNDEISHYVSGLFVHDYLAYGIPRSFLAYLRWWHSHYAYVGIGHWGPLYYLVEAVWMMLFGESRASVFLLAAGVTAATAIVLYRIVSVRLGRVAGTGMAVALVLSPLVQVGTSELMLDMPITLCCLLASLAFGRYLATGRAVYSILFGVIATAALLMKGNAASLAFVPVFSIAFSGKWSVLRRPSLWAAALIVVAVAGPWYALSYGQVAAGFRYAWGWDYTSVALPAFAAGLLTGPGAVFAVLGLLGFLRVCLRGVLLSDGGVTAAMAALFAGVFLFQVVAPADIQFRYLSPALPPLLYLAADVVCRLAAAWAPRRRGVIEAAVFCGGIAAIVPSSLHVPAKPQIGAIAAARELWSERRAQNPAVLVVADEIAEGAMIVELAMQDPSRPSLFAIRGSRLLGGGGYNNQDYVPRFLSPQDVMDAIDRFAIPFVVVRSRPGHNRWKHIDQVEQARALQPQRWTLVYSSGPPEAPWRIYRIAGNDAETADPSRLEQLSAPHALGGG
jgi:hypothetical protein